MSELSPTGGSEGYGGRDDEGGDGMPPRKNFKFTFPFEPPWEDLRKTVVASNGTKCYIFDTCVVTDPEERAQIDRNIADIIIRNDQRKFLRELDQKEQEQQEGA